MRESSWYPEFRMVVRNFWCLGSMVLEFIIMFSERPMMPLSGVRSSCDTRLMNASF